MKSKILKSLKIVSYFLVALIVLYALALNASRFLLPKISEHREALQRWASELLHQSVIIEKVSARWDGLLPEIQLDNVSVCKTTRKNCYVHADRLLVKIDVLESLWERALRPHRLAVLGVDIHPKNKKVISFQGMQVLRGKGYLILWPTWHSGRLDNLQARVNLSHFSIEEKNKRAWRLDRLKGDVNWQRRDNGWQVNVDQFALKLKGKAFKAHSLAYRVVKEKGGAKHLVNVDRLDLGVFKGFSDLLPTKFREAYRNIKPRGQLRDVALTWQGEVSSPTHVMLSTSFEKVSVRHYQNFPGVKGLSGRLVLNKNRGQLWLNSPHIELSVPKAFKQSMAFEGLQTRVDWWHKDNGWQVKTDRVSLRDGNLSADFRLHLTMPENAKPKIELLSRFEMKDVSRLKNYIPTRKLSPVLSLWLRDSFVRGELRDGSLIWRGELSKFPYRDHSGRFAVQVNVHDVGLRYHPKWPALKHVNGVLSVNGVHMVVESPSLFTENNKVRARMEINDLRHAFMMIHGESETDMKAGLGFLKKMPLPVAKQFSGLKGEGVAQVGIDLAINLASHPPHVSSKGKIHFKDAQLQLPSWYVALQSITGDLPFHDNTISAKHIRAKLLDQPFLLNVSTEVGPEVPRHVQVEFKGNANVDQLRKRFHLSSIENVAGRSRLHGLLALYSSAEHHANMLSIESDLRGITISGLPKGLAKRADEAKPLRIDIELPEAMQPIQLTASYANLLTSALSWRKTGTQLEFLGGEIGFDVGPVQRPRGPGIVVRAHLREFQWSYWQPFLKPLFSSAKNKKSSGLSLRAAEISVDQLHAFDKVWKNVYLTAGNAEQYWNINVKSPAISGELNVPKQVSLPWKGRFDYAYLPKFKLSKNHKLKPEQIPPLDLIVHNFHYGSHHYGGVKLITQSRPEGMHIDTFQIVSKPYRLTLSGDWIAETEKIESYTKLKGNFAIYDTGGALSDWGLERLVTNGRGALSFALDWPGSPLQLDFAHVSGEFKFDLKNGNIQKISSSARAKLGFGRILNLLSLQSIPQRLTLNFSDLTHRGFHFSVLRGDFVLLEGQAETADTYLEGPVAGVRLSGRVGIAEKDYDLTMTVLPHVTSSAPLIAGLAGGPIAGVATWVASKILSPTISRAMSSSYGITGTWDKPKVVKLKHAPG